VRLIGTVDNEDMIQSTGLSLVVFDPEQLATFPIYGSRMIKVDLGKNEDGTPKTANRRVWFKDGEVILPSIIEDGPIIRFGFAPEDRAKRGWFVDRDRVRSINKMRQLSILLTSVLSYAEDHKGVAIDDIAEQDEFAAAWLYDHKSTLTRPASYTA